VAVRALARSATTDEQLATLRDLASDDVDLGWRALVRLAAVGHHDPAAVEALAERDPDPDTWVRVLSVEAARPSTEAKNVAWEAMVDEHRVPVGAMMGLSKAFWQPSHTEALVPFVHRYPAMLPGISQGGMIPAMAAAVSMFPWYGVSPADLDRIVEAAADEAVSPIVSARVLESADQLRRMLVARG
jgi:aminopeptidase N